MLIENNKYFCPICNSWSPLSDYLHTVFIGDEKSEWLSNMITHYRHNHITSWNKCWGRYGDAYRSGWFKEDDYDKKKKETNERAKRQIIRMCFQFLLEHEISKAEFVKLNSEPETLALAYEKLENAIPFSK